MDFDAFIFRSIKYYHGDFLFQFRFNSINSNLAIDPMHFVTSSTPSLLPLTVDIFSTQLASLEANSILMMHHTWHIYPLVIEQWEKQSRLFTWLMSKWDFNLVTQPSPWSHICMSVFLIWKMSLLRTTRHPSDAVTICQYKSTALIF